MSKKSILWSAHGEPGSVVFSTHRLLAIILLVLSVLGCGGDSASIVGAEKVESARASIPPDRAIGFDACIAAVVEKSVQPSEWLWVAANPLLGGGTQSDGVRVEGQVYARGHHFSFECKYWSGTVQDLSWLQAS